MVTMKNAEAIARLTILRELEKLNITLPTIAGYRIVQNIHALVDALVPYNTVRDTIIKSHAKDGKTVVRENDPAAFEACMTEIAELDQLDITLEVQTFPFSCISDKELPLNVMFALDFMIDKSK